MLHIIFQMDEGGILKDFLILSEFCWKNSWIELQLFKVICLIIATVIRIKLVS